MGCFERNITGRFIGRAILAVPIVGGLHREKTGSSEGEQIQQKEARWIIIDLPGKIGKIRSVLLPAWTKVALYTWSSIVVNTDGDIIRGSN